MKYRKIMLFLLSAGLMSGCGNASQPDQTPSDAKNTPEAAAESTPAENTAPETAPYAGFEKGTVLYDKDDVRIALDGIEDDGSHLTISCMVENSTDHVVRVNFGDGYFDGVYAERTNVQIGDFEPGAKETKSVTYSEKYFEYYITDEPHTIEMNVDIWDLDHNNKTDSFTAALESAENSSVSDPAAALQLLGEMNAPEPVRFYQMGLVNRKLPVCFVPSGIPARALARLAMPQAMRSSFVNPSCMGVMVGDWSFLVYIDESDVTEKQAMYDASDFLINGEPASCYAYTVQSHPGHGSVMMIGVPEGVTPDDIQSFSFTIHCGDRQSVEVSWSF